MKEHDILWIIRAACSAVMALGFLYLFGVVGGLDTESVSLGGAVVRCLVAGAAMLGAYVVRRACAEVDHD